MHVSRSLSLCVVGLLACSSAASRPATEQTTPAATEPPPPIQKPTADEALGPAEPRVHGEEVDYSAGDVKLQGYLAYDKMKEDPRPGVLVVHEWWGHNEYVRKRARMLADMGYTAFALDMYGAGKLAEHPGEAQEFMMEIMGNMKEAKARFQAAYDLLAKHDTTNPDEIAAIGYCFGGSVVLHMAREGFDLDAVVSFHGSLATEQPAEAGDIHAKVLVLTGGADSMVPPQQVEAFKKEMESAKADYEVISYPGAKHAFTNPAADEAAAEHGIPLGYDAEADADSWKRMKAFLESAFTDS